MNRPLIAALTIVAALTGALPRHAEAQSSLPLKYTGKPTETAITPADAMTRLYIFADDSMLGRRAGEIGGLKGTAYIEREVRRLGLIPAGDNGTFFQAVPLYKRSFDASSKLLADEEPLAAGTDYVPLHPGGTPRSLDGVQIVYAGTTADAESMIPTDKGAGKIVAITGSTSGIARRYPTAAGYLVIRPDAAMPQVRRFAMNPATLMKSDDDTTKTSITLIAPNSAAAKFLGVPLENARPGTIGRTLHGQLNFTSVDAPARNVVAIIPGSDPKLSKEFVAIGAHNDHLGLRRAGPADTDSLR
ncbi:MAG: hypothetical protein ACM31F_08670, partial [Gemmatimonas sp.]